MWKIIWPPGHLPISVPIPFLLFSFLHNTIVASFSTIYDNRYYRLLAAPHLQEDPEAIKLAQLRIIAVLLWVIFNRG